MQNLKLIHLTIFCAVAVLALLPISYFSINKMTLDLSVSHIVRTDSRTNDTYEKFNNAFQGNTVLFVIAKIDNIFSDKGVKNIYEMSQTLNNIPGISDIKSLTHSARPIKGNFNLDFTKIISFKNFLDLEPKTLAEWEKIKKFTLEYPMSKNILVSADGQYAIIMGILDKNIITIEQKKSLLQLTQDNLQLFNKQGIETHLFSEPFLAAEFNDLTHAFLIKFIIISLLLVTLTIYLSFKSWQILLQIISFIIIGLLIYPPIFYFNHTMINVFTIIVIPLVSAIHLTFLIHFFSVFQMELNKFNNVISSLDATYKITFKPSFLAYLTSAAGLASLMFSKVEMLKTVGVVGLESLTTIFIMTFLPAILIRYLNKTVAECPHEPQTPTAYNSSFIFPFIVKYQKIIISTAFLLTALITFFSVNLTTDVRIKEFLQENSMSRKSLNLLDEHFGGINILQLEVRTNKANGIQNYKVIEYLHNLREKTMKLDGVSDALTYSQFYTTIHQLFLGDELSTGNVLPNEATTNLYTTIINSFNFPFQDVLQSNNRQSTVFFLKTRDLPTKDFLKVIDKFSVLTKENLPEGTEIQLKDGIQTLLKSNQEITDTQINSLGTSIFSIFLILLLIWRTWYLSFVAIICNLVPLLFIAGTMLIFNIPINAITVMVSAIIISISIDDSIHFLSYYQKLNESLPNEEAVKQALAVKLKPMVSTSILLIICFTLFTLAPFKPVNDFGFLGAVSLLGGLLSSILLLPTLLLKKNKKNSKN